LFAQWSLLDSYANGKKILFDSVAMAFLV